MAGVSTLFGMSEAPSGSSPLAVYVSEDAADARCTRLAAAVVWRVPAVRPRRPLRDLVRRLRHRLGPLGLGLHLRGSFRPWTGSAGPNGEQETLYDPERRVVRVLGREHPLPAVGRTLVLLIDETAAAGRAPSVTTRVLELPAIPRPRAATAAAGNEAEAGGPGEDGFAWTEILRRDPAVRPFLAGLGDGA